MPAYDKLKILIVEDEKHTRTLILRLLIQIGVRSIAEADSGKAGISEVLRVRPDLIFCDVHMAGGDGLTFLRQVRTAKLPGIAHTPIVFLTGDAQSETVRLAKEYAINGYLVKPVSLNDLRSRIDAALGTA